MKQNNKLIYFKIGLVISLFLFAFAKVNAQVNTYTFVQSSGTYTPITGGTIVATATDSSGVGSLDDVIYDLPAGTFPFSFTFDNAAYTGCKISTNGFITFGTVAPAASGSTTGYVPLSAATAYNGAVSGLGRNLNSYFIPGNAAQTGELRYQVLGSSPNRTFVIQYKNFKNASTGNTYGSVLNLQIRMSETSNVIAFVYNCSGTFASSPSQVGLRGPNNTFPANINNRSVVNATNTWLTSVSGTANNSSCVYITGNLPPAGLTYTFSPAACPSPITLGAANITQTTAQLTWISAGGGGTFKVEYGLSGFTPGTGTVINNAVSPQSISGLTASANYQFYVQQNCGANGTSPNSGPYTFSSGGPGEDCSSAILITVKASLASCGYTTVTSGVSQNGPDAICSDATGNVADDDRWLKFVAPASGNKLVIYTTAGTINDWTMQLWKACSGNPADVVKCADDDNAFMPQITLCQNEYVAGQTYYIRAWTYSHNVSGTMNLCVYEDTPCLLPPTNDECNVSSTILVNQSGGCPANASTYTTKGATASTGFSATCDASVSQRDIFFTFNTDIYGDIKITFTKLSATNLKAQVLFDCNGGELFCWNPADGATKTITGLNPNADYILRVWSDSIGWGTFTVCMSDACSNPTAVLSGTQTICPGGTAQMYVDFTGSAPFSFSYTDGTTTIPVVTSNNPYSLLVSPSANKTYSLLSMSDATCSGTVSGTAVVTIATPPNVTLANFTPVCANSGIVALSGGSPAGGTYSGTGVSGGSFDPTVGTQTITYTVNFGIGCSGSASKVFTVNPLPNVTLAAFTPVCSNAGLITLTGGSPAGGTYSGTNVSAGKFNPTGGDQTITYTYTNANNCTKSASQLFTVNPAPSVSFTSLTPVCTNTAPFALTGGFPSGGIYSGTGVSAGNFNPSTAGAGTFVLTYSYTNGSGCTATDTSSITVNAGPVVSFASLSAVCVNAAAFALTGGSPVGGTYSGTGVSAGSFNPATAGVGTFIITYSFTNASGCSASDTSAITVSALPVVSFASLNGVCSNAAAFVLTGGSPAGGTYSGTGVSAGSFNPATAGLGTFILTYTFTNASGCIASDTSAIVVTNCNGCTGPPVTGAIIGSIGACVPVNGQVYSVPAQAGVTFTWSVPANVTIASGQGTNSIATNWASNAANGSVCVIASNTCGTSPSTCKTVTKRTALPATPGAITGSTNGCPGETKLYTIRKVATADQYLWTPPFGSTINGSSLPFTTVDTMVNVTFTASYPTGGDTLHVRTVNCKGTSNAQKTLKIGKALPTTPGAITGQASALCNLTGVVYSIVPVATATTYTWATTVAGVTINGGASPLTTAATNVTLNFGTFTTGTLTVKSNNGCGVSANKSLALTSKPAKPGVITGPTTVCTNTTGTAYSIAAVIGASSYTWTAPASGTIATGQGTTSVTVNFGATTGTANLTVRANGTACGNSTNRTLAITRNLCPRFGDEATATSVLSVFPNPTHDLMNVLFNASADTKYKLTLTDVEGRVVLVKLIDAIAGENKFELNVEKIPQGVYAMNLQSADATMQLRIIVE